MLVYVGGRFTVTVEGSVTKQVACEKCRTLYGYSLAGKASGTGRSPYYADNDGAKRRAHERARANLHNVLYNRVEVVPCPTCGWLQANMAHAVCKKQYNWMLLVGILACCLGGLVGFISFVISATSNWQDWFYMLAALPIAGAGIALFVYRKRLQATYDPNIHHSARAGRSSAGVFIIPVAQVAPARVGPPPIPWFYVKDGRRQGPISATDLSGLASSGGLSPTDLVWNPGMPDWASAASLPGLLTA